MKLRKYSLFLSGLAAVLLLLNSLSAYSETCTAINNGDWEDYNTWSCAKRPACGDSIIIPTDKTVTIVHAQEDYSACSSALIIEIYGTLQFVNGFKLRLNCISVIRLHTGATIAITGGGGSNNLIEYCNNVMWRAACGNLTGPLIIPPYDCDTPFPINLVSFSAEKKSSTCVLNWITANEVNNDYFILERSIDSESFEEIGRTRGAGNSSTNLYYAFTDASPLHGISYYRLKQVDYDGAFTYSKIVSINMKADLAKFLKAWVDYPDESISIMYNGDAGHIIGFIITDIMGKEITKGTVVTSVSPLKISCGALAHGSYFITLSDGSTSVSGKIFY